MQQTQTYKLNLIETSDTFSPAPLNENMEKVEAQFSAEAAARQSGDAALDQRVTVLEGRKIVIGSYVGNGVDRGQFINLGFTPNIVLAQSNLGAWMASPSVGAGILVVQDKGFMVLNSSSTANLNKSNFTYSYLAIL